MPALSDLIHTLESLAPPHLTEDWDNTGLLLGDPAATVSRILTCLTLTEDVADEAVATGVHLIVTHHPLMFRPLQQITTADSQGRTLLKLMQARIAVYSPHTCYDNAPQGINQQLAEQLHLTEIQPLRNHPTAPQAGSGRYGNLPTPLALKTIRNSLRMELKTTLAWVGDAQASIRRIGIACGSAAEYLSEAVALGCDLFITGEARFHDSLRARDLGIAMILLGHYASERPGIEQLARQITLLHPDSPAIPSQTESDPLQYL